jgi:hypothetical protein
MHTDTPNHLDRGLLVTVFLNTLYYLLQYFIHEDDQEEEQSAETWYDFKPFEGGRRELPIDCMICMAK